MNTKQTPKQVFDEMYDGRLNFISNKNPRYGQITDWLIYETCEDTFISEIFTVTYAVKLNGAWRKHNDVIPLGFDNVYFSKDARDDFIKGLKDKGDEVLTAEYAIRKWGFTDGELAGNTHYDMGAREESGCMISQKDNRDEYRVIDRNKLQETGEYVGEILESYLQFGTEHHSTMRMYAGFKDSINRGTYTDGNEGHHERLQELQQLWESGFLDGFKFALGFPLAKGWKQTEIRQR